MAPNGHQLTINLPFSPGKCLLLLICFGVPLALFLETFISMMFRLWTTEIEQDFMVEPGFLKYEFNKSVGSHQCDGRMFKCAPAFGLNVRKMKGEFIYINMIISLLID